MIGTCIKVVCNFESIPAYKEIRFSIVGIFHSIPILKVLLISKFYKF